FGAGDANHSTAVEGSPTVAPVRVNAVTGTAAQAVATIASAITPAIDAMRRRTARAPLVVVDLRMFSISVVLLVADT
ncbi:MAG: hypothetical protein JHD40_09335, partial [Acidimicrobiia bacterium]|nr:hypothetical protein [Acidimicrobiia bacterium]